MPSRALITGFTGQDGSYLAELLAARGDVVIGVTRADAPLADHAALRRVVTGAAPDLVFHLAAPTFVPSSWDNPEQVLGEIAGATSALLDACAALATPPRVFVASSAEIFGDAGESPLSEQSPKRPRSPYGEAKLAAHEAVSAARNEGLYAVSGILFNHESPRRPQHFLPRKVTRGAAAIALGLEDELVLGSQDAVRDWSHAADIMRGAALSLEADEPQDYVLASGIGHTVAQLVEAAFDAADVAPERRNVRVDPEFVRPPEEFPPIGDATRAREVLGWQPQIGFEELIAEMVAADLAALRG